MRIAVLFFIFTAVLTGQIKIGQVEMVNLMKNQTDDVVDKIIVNPKEPDVFAYRYKSNLFIYQNGGAGSIPNDDYQRHDFFTWIPEGDFKGFVYVAFDNNSAKLYRRTNQSATTNFQLDSARSIKSPNVFPDGKRILYIRDKNSIYILDLQSGTGNGKTLSLPTGYEWISCSLSPDGKALVLQGKTRSQNNFGIHLYNFTDGSCSPLYENTSIKASFPRWSRDGKTILFLLEDPPDLRQGVKLMVSDTVPKKQPKTAAFVDFRNEESAPPLFTPFDIAYSAAFIGFNSNAVYLLPSGNLADKPLYLTDMAEYSDKVYEIAAGKTNDSEGVLYLCKLSKSKYFIEKYSYSLHVAPPKRPCDSCPPAVCAIWNDKIKATSGEKDTLFFGHDTLYLQKRTIRHQLSFSGVAVQYAGDSKKTGDLFDSEFGYSLGWDYLLKRIKSGNFDYTVSNSFTFGNLKSDVKRLRFWNYDISLGFVSRKDSLLIFRTPLPEWGAGIGISKPVLGTNYPALRFIFSFYVKWFTIDNSIHFYTRYKKIFVNKNIDSPDNPGSDPINLYEAGFQIGFPKEANFSW